MKATITVDGILEITPENSLEDYALSSWSKDNLRGESKLLLLPYEDSDEMREEE